MIVNGQQQKYIEIADRAFQYGDGCFTTIAYRNGHIELFSAHLNRLKLACETLYINFDKWSELESCVIDYLKPNTDCVVKIVITRGKGGRGYSPVGATSPNYIITHHDIPSHYKEWQTNGIELTISPITLARQPLLAGIKHLNRLEQVLIKHALATTQYDDAIVCDTQQKIVETSVGNLFWYNDHTWYTPSLTECGVEGVMRNFVLAVLREKSIKHQVVQQDVDALFSAQELFICNSLMEMVPVMTLFNPANQKSKTYSVSQTKRLQQVVKVKATEI